MRTDFSYPVTDKADIRHWSLNTEAKREMARLIEDEFQSAGYPPEIAAAAILNAIAESALDPGSAGDRSQSQGLFQIRAIPDDPTRNFNRKDPVLNIRWMLDEMQRTRRRGPARNVASKKPPAYATEHPLIAYERGVRDLAWLSAMFGIYCERYDYVTTRGWVSKGIPNGWGDEQRRWIAQRLFPAWSKPGGVPAPGTPLPPPDVGAGTERRPSGVWGNATNLTLIGPTDSERREEGALPEGPYRVRDADGRILGVVRVLANTVHELRQKEDGRVVFATLSSSPVRSSPIPTRSPSVPTQPPSKPTEEGYFYDFDPRKIFSSLSSAFSDPSEDSDEAPSVPERPSPTPTRPPPREDRGLTSSFFANDPRVRLRDPRGHTWSSGDVPSGTYQILFENRALTSVTLSPDERYTASIGGGKLRWDRA